VAGIIFSLLMMTSMILISTIIRAIPADISRDWLENWSNTA
jgi:hypothetical protein